MSELTIHIPYLDDPYRNPLKNFLVSNFPEAAKHDKCAQFEGVYQAILGNSKIRNGPQPNPEGLVHIRKAVQEAMASNRPVPFEVSWGSRKPGVHRSVDMAEFCAVKTLLQLDQRVKEFYAPGIQANVRVEDASGFYMFRNEGPEVRKSSERYIDDFIKLIHILQDSGKPKAVRTVLESELPGFSTKVYGQFVDAHWTHFYHHLLEPTAASLAGLAGIGWKGNIGPEQKQYYIDRYATAYPHLTEDDRLILLSEYFAGALARYQLNGRANDPDWTTWVNLTFVGMIPGVPPELENRLLRYRAIHADLSRTHVMPWRARGILVVNEQGTSVKPRLESWHKELAATPATAVLRRGGEELTLRCDYVVE